MPPSVGVSVISIKVGSEVAVSASLTVPSQQHAVRGIYFDEAARHCRAIEVEVERLPHEWSCHRVPIILTRPAHIQEP